MSVTVVMAESDALACFPSVIPWPWIQGQVKSAPPSVKWIVVAGPLACERCGGSGRIPSPWSPNDMECEVSACPDCHGTGLPDVQIVSDKRDQWIDEGTSHGVVTVGAAVLIVSMTAACADGFDLDRFILAPVSHGETIVMPVLSDGVEIQITDQFGSQAVTPGHYAHPILSSLDGTDAATTAA